MAERGRAFLKEGERIRMFRKRLKIHVEGNDVADPLQTFEGLSQVLPTNDDAHIVNMLLQNIEDSKYKEPTPIQMQAVPCMAEGRDVLAVAPTGSGKTCAFLLPLLASILKKPKAHGRKKKRDSKTGLLEKDTPDTVAAVGPRAIVITPTRELAVQIHREFNQLSKGKKFRSMVLSKANTGGITASGSGSSGTQQQQTLLAQDFVVSTPMRLVHVITRGVMDVSGCQAVVLDEADRLFEEGFLEQIDTILGECRV